METAGKSVEELQTKILILEEELNELKKELTEAQSREQSTEDVEKGIRWKWPLKADEYERYGRQLILPHVGIKGQLRLKSSSVLVVGGGGLGCPAAVYLAGAGIGTIGIVDGDTVELSNLHRQIAHSTSRVGKSKVESIISSLKELNPTINYRSHSTHLMSTNAEAIVAPYDLVLDCTDHPTSRYLISDVCVLLQKPLVSASALRTDGQLIVLNCPPTPQGSVDGDGGPCYRCLFPKPPPPDSVLSCGEGGILGPVVGIMGVLQALEAIKIIAAGRHHPPETDLANGALKARRASSSTEPNGGSQPQPTLLLFSSPSTGPPTLRNVRMRGRRRECLACSNSSTLTLETLRSGSLDYVQFCGGVSAPLHILDADERISAAEYSRRFGSGGPDSNGSEHLLLDVREREHFAIASIDGAVNVPFSTTQQQRGREKVERNGGVDGKGTDGAEEGEARPEWIPPGLSDGAPILVVCRVGNDSQIIARQLKDMGLGRGGERFIGDIKGGMRAWKAEVDETLPFT